ncbi:hypothetical protein BDW68DRAFT_95525 [Aspergillus falconensis]
MKLPKIYNTYFVAFIATVGGILFGFDISSMSAIIGTDQYNDYFDNPAGLRQGAIGSSHAAGSVVGSAIAGYVSDKIGRRDSIAFACIWWLVGTAVQTAHNGFGSFIAGWVLNGVCVGITSSQVPVYLAEIAKKENRGQLIVIQQLAIGMGYPDHVFRRIWMQLHPRYRLFPDRLGNSICAMRILAAIHFFFTYPETCGKTLEV